MTPVGMMINILHKLLSMGTVAARAVMEGVLLEVPGESKACMVNHIKGTGRPNKRATTSIRPLLRTRVPLHISTHLLVETVRLPEVSAAMGVQGRHSQRKTLSNIPALVLATMAACLMCLGVLSRAIKGRTPDSVPTWANRAVTTIHFAIIVTRPRGPMVPVLPWASLEDVQDLLQTSQVRQDCHSRKGKVRASKATVVIWAIRCMVSRARSTVEAQEAWVAVTTSPEDRTIKLVATALTAPDMARGSMVTATGVDGGRTMGTKVHGCGCMHQSYLSTSCSFTWTCTLLTQNKKFRMQAGVQHDMEHLVNRR